jgi:hypothetical protein
VARFDEFSERLEAVKLEGTPPAWLSFFESFGYYPAETTRELVEKGVIADGAEPDWYDEGLVAPLVGALQAGCPSVFVNDTLVVDLWDCKYRFIHILHEVCAGPGEHLQACLLRLLLLDRYMLGVAMENCGDLPAALAARCRSLKKLHENLSELALIRSRKNPGYHEDNIDREAASSVVFRYRYPCCLLRFIADESLLSPDQAGQLVRASGAGGILERFRQALPPEAEWVKRDVLNLAEFLAGLSKPYPWLHSIAYGT